jgi:uncharacterized membrane protein
MKTFKDMDLQAFISNLLRTGVIVAMTIVVIGLVMFVIAHGSQPAVYNNFDATHVFSFSSFLDSLLQGNSSAIMELGVMVLIATPVARVLFTMIGFWLEKDRMYTVIAFLVLCIIIGSMLYGAVE